MDKAVNTRLWEIDTLRGLALILMVVYHLLYDLHVFFDFNVPYDQGLIYLMGKAAGVLFIFVAGISSSFSLNNTVRALKLVAWGYVIFVVAGLFVPESNIVFGILQFLGVCILFSPVFRKLPALMLVLLGTAIIGAGKTAAQCAVTQAWLIPLGLGVTGFYSTDYFPLIPWSGVFLLGMAVQKMVYQSRQSLFAKVNKAFKPLMAVGRHTLVIYLLHQPVMLAALYLLLDPQALVDMGGNLLD